MPTNDLKQLADSGGANVLTQAEYLALTTLLANGFVNGVADPAQVNKVLRQATFAAAMIGQFTVDNSGDDVLDDGDLATFQASFTAGVEAIIAAAIAAGSVTNQVLIVRDEKASGTNGGGSTATTVMTRDLNTVAKNTITGASVVSNQITLTAGTYSIRASAPAFVNHQARLYNVTDAANTIIGTSENANPAAEADPTHARSFVVGEFTIAGTKVFELQDWTLETRATNGLGSALGSGAVEVFSEVEIRRIA